ncbi:MAG: hypothetical protein HY902_20045, partial [Deltaproteobacteria bacterium]|nr:hypothetical protein [Deltaproteobacteria bacterium]
MRTLAQFLAISCLPLCLACSSAATPAPTATADAASDGAAATDTAATADASPDAGPVPLSQRKLDAPQVWATPIADYQKVGKKYYGSKYDKSITDLAAAEGKLWLGYGDGTYNLGEKIPIEFRYFNSPDDPSPSAALCKGEGQGEVQQTPYQTGEEVIGNFRVFDGALWQAGLDSIDADELWTQAHTSPKSIQGNVYFLEGGAWQKRRTVTGGEHVQDVVGWKGAVYAVGSGADLRSEFEAGQVFRYLWRSTDKAQTFQTVQRVKVPEDGKGDTRWVTLMPLGDALYLFGYVSHFATGKATIANALYDGATVTTLDATDELATLYPDGTLALAGGRALFWGVDVSAQPAVRTVAIVSPNAQLTVLDAFDGYSLLDVAYAAETDDVLYLLAQGEVSATSKGPFDVRVWTAKGAKPGQTTELLQADLAVRPTALALWQGSVWLGDATGQVLRA